MSHFQDKTAYYPALDGLRGIAILLVLFFHQMVMVPAGPFDVWVKRFGKAGWIGVDLFFVLSGFLITGILLRNKGTKGYFRTFYARRVLRIFPLYYAALAVSFLVLPLVDAPAAAFPDERGDQWWYWLYLSNVLFSIRHEFRHSILGPTWSLAIEEQFYLLWPLLVFLFSPRALKRICTALIAGAFFLRFALQEFGVHWIPLYVLSPTRIDALAAGSLIAALVHLYGHTKRLQAAGLLLLAAGACAAGGLIAADELVHRSAFMQRWGYTAMAALFAGAVICALKLREGSLFHRLLTSRLLTACGKYSYAMYLFNHSVYSMVMLYWFAPEDLPLVAGHRAPGQLVFSMVCTILTAALAVCSWHLLERPFLRLKRYFPYSHNELEQPKEELPPIRRAAKAA